MRLRTFPKPHGEFMEKYLVKNGELIAVYLSSSMQFDRSAS
jgi:hypothetical protein